MDHSKSWHTHAHTPSTLLSFLSLSPSPPIPHHPWDAHPWKRMNTKPTGHRVVNPSAPTNPQLCVWFVSSTSVRSPAVSKGKTTRTQSTQTEKPKYIHFSSYFAEHFLPSIESFWISLDQLCHCHLVLLLSNTSKLHPILSAGPLFGIEAQALDCVWRSFGDELCCRRAMDVFYIHGQEVQLWSDRAIPPHGPCFVFHVIFFFCKKWLLSCNTFPEPRHAEFERSCPMRVSSLTESPAAPLLLPFCQLADQISPCSGINFGGMSWSILLMIGFMMVHLMPRKI